MHDISDFRHLVFDVPRNYMHDIVAWIEEHPNTVAAKKEE